MDYGGPNPIPKLEKELEVARDALESIHKLCSIIPLPTITKKVDKALDQMERIRYDAEHVKWGKQ